MQKTIEQVMESIRFRMRKTGGVPYPQYYAYIGTNPFSKREVRLYATTKEELVKKIHEYFRDREETGGLSMALRPDQIIEASEAFLALEKAGLEVSLMECVEREIARQKQSSSCNLNQPETAHNSGKESSIFNQVDAVNSTRWMGKADPKAQLTKEVRTAFAEILKGMGGNVESVRRGLAQKYNEEFYNAKIKPLFEAFLAEARENAARNRPGKAAQTAAKPATESVLNAEEMEVVNTMAPSRPRRRAPAKREAVHTEMIDNALENPQSMVDVAQDEEVQEAAETAAPATPQTAQTAVPQFNRPQRVRTPKINTPEEYNNYIARTWIARAGRALTGQEMALRTGDEGLARQYVGEFARNWWKLSCFTKPEMDMDARLNQLAEKMNLADRNGNFGYEDARNALLARDGFEPVTRNQAQLTYEQLLKAKELADQGKLEEAAEVAGFPWLTEAGIRTELDRRIGKQLDKKLSVLESRLNEEDNDALRGEVQTLIDALRDIRHGNKSTAELMSQYADMANFGFLFP